MKNLIQFLLFTVAISLILPSCSKDSDGDQDVSDRLVGTWNVLRAEATAYVDGYAIDGITVNTDGTLKFNSDGSGKADFSMSFLDTNEAVEGNFNWERSGFEIVLTMDGEELRYAVITDEPNYQELQVTYKDEEDGDEVEFLFIMERS